MKRFLLLLFAILSLSCSSPREEGALFLYNTEDPYVAVFGRQIQMESGPLLDIRTYNAQNSQIIQNESIESEIVRAGVMIINPVDRLGAYTIIRRLRSEDIPVIFFNREPLAEDLALWDKAFYVGARAEQSGRIQAELVMDLFGADPRELNRHDLNGNNIIEAVILKGEQGHQDAEIRTREVVDAFAEKGFALHILITEVANWKRQEAYDKMKPILDQYNGSVELIISNNDAMALGAVSLMRQSGFFRDDNGDGVIGKDDLSWRPVVGIDGLEEAQDMIEQGYMYGTVLNDSHTQAKAIVDLAEVLLEGGDLDDLSYPLEKGKYIWIDYKVFQ
ncbi:galactose ABC transporter substrate-binding protein [Spirochaeta isovalerica]|uniref:D-galactose/methyl-galactoside binding periplasmic protein MglB n=1 Tax=Spirochaeta isovalerica TaxID=150 RepID=A0A841RCR6_9SPIO|nr:galactose ABC transporter substrate-binding protein [Spirochaeta isovalerica]MBB6481456.1 methyl-galactoside transport system substrate-binding protein [Spirochaeta isovalerica]